MLAGDDARRAGRLDAARERYRKAHALVPTAVNILVSTGALELRDNKLDAALELTNQALAIAPTDPDATLLAAELDIRSGRLAEAGTRLTSMRDSVPPLASDQLGRLHLLNGMRLEASGQLEPALGAYQLATTALGKEAVSPIVAAAILLAKMAATADAAKDTDKAKLLRARSDALLGGMASTAESDPALAVTLGVAYLAAGVPMQSESWLRKALARRPRDVEAHFQLAEALRQQGNQAEAIATLGKAFELDPNRIDLGIELARSFEAAGRDAAASALYTRLLNGKAVSVDVRVRAGRFFARTRDIPSARIQGDEILKVDENNSAGLYLRGEGLLADGRPGDARRLFKQAVDRDLDPQYLDALGRASEATAASTGDTGIRDDALRTYIEASALAPTMLHPVLARGRLHLAGRDYAKALVAYEAALALAPTNPEIPYGMGVAYDQLDEPALAIKWLNRAVAIEPFADAFFRLGSLHYEANQPGPAASALTRATEYGLKEERHHGTAVPWLTAAYRMLGSVELLLHHDRAARMAWEAYLDRAPTDPVQADEVRRELLGLRGR
jgi:tetratricopeptide (TPR) repeat protein